MLTITAWERIIRSLRRLALSAVVERGTGITWNRKFISQLLFLVFFGTSLAAEVWYTLCQHDDVGRLALFFFPSLAFGLAIAVAGMIPTAWEVSHSLAPPQVVAQ